jgi:hypothetical protein
MKKYYIDLNTDEDNPLYIEIKTEAIPKTRTEHVTLMKKYGANKALRNRYLLSVGLSPE